jgi:hypothetical protein
MDRALLRWAGVILGFALVVPVVFYVLTGTVLGFLLPCSGGVLELFVYDGSALAVPCSTVGTAVKLGVAVWGTTFVGVLVFLIGFADLFGSASGY